MDTKTYLYKTQDRVEWLLRNYEPARADDCILYAEYIREFHRSLSGVDLITAFENHERFGLPSYESITRSRRKVQAMNENLRPKNDNRLDLEGDYSEWAVNR